jgi:hypothetical protein
MLFLPSGTYYPQRVLRAFVAQMDAAGRVSSIVIPVVG